MAYTLALVALLAFPCWYAAFRRPQLVPLLLFAWVCLTGVLMARLGFSGPGKLAKDVLFVLPLYAAVFFVRPDLMQSVRLPTALLVVLGLFAALAIVQVGNPGVGSPMVGLLGLKVWLLYVPLIFAVAAALEDEEAVQRFLRGALVVCLIVFGVGMLQYVLTIAIGYEAAIALFHGAAAKAATQNFANFLGDQGFFGRIPATFASSAEYYNFCGIGLTVAYAAMRFDPQRRWRLLGLACLLLGSIAYILSGSRGALAFLAMFYGLILFLDRQVVIGFLMPILTGAAVLVFAGVVGLDLLDLGTTTRGLARVYSLQHGLGGTWDLLIADPFGTGTGSGTLAARHVVGDANVAWGRVFEGTYGKAGVEFGFLGPFVVLAVLLTLVAVGFQTLARCATSAHRGVAAAILTYLCIEIGWSLKGLHFDLDPTNVAIWMLVGVLLRLPTLSQGGAPVRSRVWSPGEAAMPYPLPRPESQPVHPFLAQLRRQPTILRPPRER